LLLALDDQRPIRRGGIQLTQHRNSATPFIVKKKIGFAVLASSLVLFAGACGGAGNAPTAAASDAPSLTGQKSPAAEPTFTYPGGPQCRITYRDGSNGTMSWTANVTVAGELITHASDTSGNIYRHDEQVTVGLNTFTAPVPLLQVTDIGGVLYVPDSSASTSYGCSVAPQR
jgi:hypothetical protein